MKIERQRREQSTGISSSTSSAQNTFNRNTGSTGPMRRKSTLEEGLVSVPQNTTGTGAQPPKDLSDIEKLIEELSKSAYSNVDLKIEEKINKGKASGPAPQQKYSTEEELEKMFAQNKTSSKQKAIDEAEEEESPLWGDDSIEELQESKQTWTFSLNQDKGQLKKDLPKEEVHHRIVLGDTEFAFKKDEILKREEEKRNLTRWDDKQPEAIAAKNAQNVAELNKKMEKQSLNGQTGINWENLQLDLLLQQSEELHKNLKTQGPPAKQKQEQQVPPTTQDEAFYELLQQMQNQPQQPQVQQTQQQPQSQKQGLPQAQELTLAQLEQSQNQQTKQQQSQIYIPPPGQDPFMHFNPFSQGVGVNENERIWYYKDPQNNVQGPFTGSAMYNWYKEGYFKDDLQIACIDVNNFITLGQFLDNIAKPITSAQNIMKEMDPYYMENQRATDMTQEQYIEYITALQQQQQLYSHGAQQQQQQYIDPATYAALMAYQQQMPGQVPSEFLNQMKQDPKELAQKMGITNPNPDEQKQLEILAHYDANNLNSFLETLQHQMTVSPTSQEAQANAQGKMSGAHGNAPSAKNINEANLALEGMQKQPGRAQAQQPQNVDPQWYAAALQNEYGNMVSPQNMQQYVRAYPQEIGQQQQVSPQYYVQNQYYYPSNVGVGVGGDFGQQMDMYNYQNKFPGLTPQQIPQQQVYYPQQQYVQQDPRKMQTQHSPTTMGYYQQNAAYYPQNTMPARGGMQQKQSAVDPKSQQYYEQQQQLMMAQQQALYEQQQQQYYYNNPKGAAGVRQAPSGGASAVNFPGTNPNPSETSSNK